jgi:hypothetical protein
MMKKSAAYILGSILLFSCSNNNSNKIAAKNDAPAEPPQRFFRVTDFLLGDIKGIATKGVTPLKITTVNNHSDSVWLKQEELGPAMAEFTTPVIDSANLIELFHETKFQDQTLNTFTFTYDPAGKLPDTMQLTHWDVYIDPETGTVKKVYMVKRKKEASQDKTLQLTWQAGKWCKATTIFTKPDGSAGVEKEETILWDFSKQ